MDRIVHNAIWVDTGERNMRECRSGSAASWAMMSFHSHSKTWTTKGLPDGSSTLFAIAGTQCRTGGTIPKYWRYCFAVFGVLIARNKEMIGRRIIFHSRRWFIWRQRITRQSAVMKKISRRFANCGMRLSIPQVGRIYRPICIRGNRSASEILQSWRTGI